MKQIYSKRKEGVQFDMSLILKALALSLAMSDMRMSWLLVWLGVPEWGGQGEHDASNLFILEANFFWYGGLGEVELSGWKIQTVLQVAAQYDKIQLDFSPAESSEVHLADHHSMDETALYS